MPEIKAFDNKNRLFKIEKHLGTENLHSIQETEVLCHNSLN